MWGPDAGEALGDGFHHRAEVIGENGVRFTFARLNCLVVVDVRV